MKIGLENIFNPVSILAPNAFAANKNKTISTIADPLDLFGNRKKQANNAANDIALTTAEKAQADLEDAYLNMKNLYAPLEEAGRQGLNQLQTGDFTPSQTYKDSLDIGNRDLSRKLRSMGRLNSTFGARKFGEFRQGAAQEEVDRQYGATLGLIKTGSDAARSVSVNGTLFGNGMTNSLSDLGNSLTNNTNSLAQQQAGTMNNLSNLASGAASYFNTQPAQQQAGTIYQPNPATPATIPMQSAEGYEWKPAV